MKIALFTCRTYNAYTLNVFKLLGNLFEYKRNGLTKQLCGGVFSRTMKDYAPSIETQPTKLVYFATFLPHH